ncbi:hypothetical protein D9Q98_010280 [Chlorella vulgaris]|uniref:Uncharacterized protein n=1 Tax=Chlorella vulgaris TaxID=3077 RepID=A0A9D4TK19_CHLVU|nr:hypothetical protein D9Q98_010280 [Chlorella vulgaris]
MAPVYDAQQLLHSLGLNCSPAELRRSMSKMCGKRQQGVLQHAAAVVAHLRGLGLEQQLLEQLLVRCPELFSWSPKERAEGLFSELMNGGLTAAEAACCFIAYPAAVRYVSFASTIAVLDEILSHSQDSNRGAEPKVPAAERTAAAMLRADPSSVKIIRLDATKLCGQRDRLLVLGCSPAAVAKLLWSSPSLLCLNANSVAQLEQAADVLHDELGLAPETVLELVASKAPGWLTYSQDTLRRRAAALAEEFGREDAASIVYVEHRQLLLDDKKQQARGVAWPWNLSRLTYSLKGFLAVLGSSQQEWDAFVAAHPAGSGPVWEWAQQEAGLEVQRLVGVLPPQLQQAAADVWPQYKSHRTGTRKL